MSGGSPTALNTVFLQPAAVAAFYEAGSRVGDGLIALDGVQGVHYGYVVATEGADVAVSGVQWFAGTQGHPSPHYTALLALQAMIIGLNLPRIGNRVEVKPLDETAANLEFPCVLITPQEFDQYGPGSTCDFTHRFPATVLFCDRSDPDDATITELICHWRYRVGLAMMSDRRLGGAVERLEIVPSPVIQEKLPAYQYVRSFLAAVLTTSKARTS